MLKFPDFFLKILFLGSSLTDFTGTILIRSKFILYIYFVDMQ